MDIKEDLTKISQGVDEFKTEYVPVIESNRDRSLKNEHNIALIAGQLKNLMMNKKQTTANFSVVELPELNNDNPTIISTNPTLPDLETKYSKRNPTAIVNMGKIPNLSIFDGNNFVPSVFITKAEDYFDTAGVYTDLDKIQAFKLLIKGKVSDWLIGIKPTFVTWEELKINFIKQWQTPFSIQKRIKEWKELTIKRDADIEAFVLQGLRLMEAIYPHYTFQQTVEEVIMKLPWRIRELLMQKCSDIKNEMQFLEAVQHTLRIIDLAPKPVESVTEFRPNSNYNSQSGQNNYQNRQNYGYRGNNNYRNFGNNRERNNYRGRPDRGSNFRPRENGRENVSNWREAPRARNEAQAVEPPATTSLNS